MGDYDSGYDPKYGYNRNAFAHKTIGTAVMGRIVKLIVTPIGLGSEAIHHYRDKKKRSASQSEKDTGAITAPSAISAEAGLNEPASPSDAKDNLKDKIYVNVPADQADELVASKQAVRADGATVTHELVPEDNQDDGIERDEVDWALDEAASETEEKEGPDAPNETLNAESTDQRASQSMLSDKSQAGKQAKAPPPKRLPFPVILPQRRPGTKARGFVRAYAPVLQDSGIGQESFVRFLKDFHRAAQASPVFNVIMIATAIAGAYPDILVGLAVQAVQIAAGVGQEIQERYRTNKFLDQANRNIFMPKGLFALIVTCKPGKSDQAEVSTETIDIGATAMVKYGGALDQAESTADSNERLEEQRNKVDEMKEKMKRLRIASGATSEAEIPITCAPLIFPALDAIVDASNQEGLDGEGVATNIKTKAKASSKFVSDYFDRRAQATYVCTSLNKFLLFSTY